MNPWRMCKDELPPVGERVVCFSPKGGQFIGYHNEARARGHEKVFFRTVGAGKGKMATHWKHLDPDPREV